MSTGIAYQNKDIMSKQFAEGMAGKSLEVYGLNVPRIRQSLNVDFPVVMANELFTDNLFLMEDYSICIIDYESRYRWSNKVKYARYITQILTRYEKLKIDIEKIWRRLSMTKVGMMFEKEKEEALKKQAKLMQKQMKDEIKKRDKQIEKKDQQLEKKDERIKAMLAEIDRLGGNAAVF